MAYIDQATACPRCAAPFGRELCTECMTRTGPQELAFSAAVAALAYDLRAQALVTAYKDGNERRLAGELAQLMAQALPLEWRLWAEALTWVPADGEALRRRGFDHMRLLADELSRRSGLTAAALLAKPGRGDQRALTRRERQANAGGLFTLLPLAEGAALPRRVLLIDDVMTTGATLDAAAALLRRSGVGEVRVATVARVW